MKSSKMRSVFYHCGVLITVHYFVSIFQKIACGKWMKLNIYIKIRLIVNTAWNVYILPFLQNTPVSKQMQQRNSNLRELPVAPGNINMNSARPAANVRPVAKATQGVRPGQNTQPVPGGGRGRGQVAAKTESQPGGEGRTVVRKEIPSTLSSTVPQVSFLTLVGKKKTKGMEKHSGIMDKLSQINVYYVFFLILFWNGTVNCKYFFLLNSVTQK